MNQLQQMELDDQAAEVLRADLLCHWDALWIFSLVEGSSRPITRRCCGGRSVSAPRALREAASSSGCSPS
jgi:hypothetical protein